MAPATMRQPRDARGASATTSWQRAQKIARRLWRGIRDWCGDSAYERYLSATRRRHSQDLPLTQEDFYVEQLNRRYSRPNRCC
jgi:uncharacterized short protein YbdD (DUF466 family)